MSNYLKLSNYVWSSTIRKDSISIATSTCTFYVLGNYYTTILTLFYTMGLNLSCSNFYFLFFFFFYYYTFEKTSIALFIVHYTLFEF